MSRKEMNKLCGNVKNLIADVEELKSIKQKEDCLTMELNMAKLLRNAIIDKINN